MHKEYQHIKVIIKQEIINIILNRPKKKNALIPEMIQELQSALDIEKNNTYTKIIILSSNSNVFCAGADIKYLEKMKDFSYSENLKDSSMLMELFKTMLKYPKLIISKVCGPAIGGGCGLVTASDIIFATENSTFGYPEVRIGFIPALVSTFLINKTTESNARELLLTGQKIDAKTAKKIGLINHVCNELDIDEKIQNLTTDIIEKTSINSIAETKNMMYIWLDLDKKLKQAAELNAKNRKTPDFKKGIAAFLNKTTINWRK